MNESTAYQTGEMIGRNIIKPLILLALGFYFGYRYIKKKQKKKVEKEKKEVKTNEKIR